MAPASFADVTGELEGNFVDREIKDLDSNFFGLYRFFLQPLAVSVDKWSMGVRGRSRTYTIADVLETYNEEIRLRVEDSLNSPGDGYPGLTTYDCEPLVPAVNSSLSALPALVHLPTRMCSACSTRAASSAMAALAIHRSPSSCR